MIKNNAMKVLITGGAGYVGTELLYRLTKNPNIKEIVIYDNLSRGNYNLFLGSDKLPDKVNFIQGDILDSRKLKSLLNDIDIVYHLAAKVTTPFADQDPHLFEQINHWGTSELTYAIEQSNVSTLIYLSSGSIYGSSSHEADIESVADPQTFYGISKLRAEAHVARLMNKSINTYIIRCGNVYGYNKSMRFDSVINRFMFDANFKRLITINGDGKQHRSFIHVDKTADTLVRLLNSQLKCGIYNLVEDTLTINYIADIIKRIYPDLEMLYINQNLRLRELKIKPDPIINKLTSIPIRSLHDVLLDFKQQFTFSPT